jgi:manganese/zinc/iron transport system permease protein
MFALGLIMIVQAADRVDLDPNCVLYGALETIVIPRRVDLLGLRVPPVVITLSVVVVANALFVFGLYRQLKVSTFDPQLAAAQGIYVSALHYLLAAFVAVTAVASFESVGNILVVAMFVVPPMTAWLLTDRLLVMILLSTVIAAACAVTGHLAAITVPRWFGFGAANTAGMMSVAAGGYLLLAVLFAPRKGVLSRGIRSVRVGMQIVGEDVLGTLYRAEQQGQARLPARELRSQLLVSSLRAIMVFYWLRWNRLATPMAGAWTLEDKGRRQAQNIVRSHRLWEQYLASEAGLPEQLLHGGAERLEHFTDKTLREKLLEETNAPDVDPHGSPIPPEAH